LLYAQKLHRVQRREADAAPFIRHPLEVAALLYLTGHAEPTVTAGIPHDAVEDTEVESRPSAGGSAQGWERSFGP